MSNLFFVLIQEMQIINIIDDPQSGEQPLLNKEYEKQVKQEEKKIFVYWITSGRKATLELQLILKEE